MRNLTKTLAIVSLLTPATAQPLGIGEIKLHSALNQRLNAEIKLMLSAGENPANVRVQMAPPTKFDEAGIPWNYYLSKIKLDKEIHTDGSISVKLRTNEVFSEPFLDFLLEVSWENGSLYREFTVLVDPPAAYEESIVPIVEKASTSTSTAPLPIQKPSEPNPVKTSANALSPSVYGPVSKTDTLWKIADKVKPSSDITNEQMMMAILESNPKAFSQGNVNFLKSGVELKIPDKQRVLQLSKRQAAKMFAEHNDKWRQLTSNYQEKVAKAEQTVEPKLDLVAPVETSVSENTVVTPKQETDSGKDTQLSQVTAEEKQQDQVAESVASTVNTATDTQVLHERMQKLEQQIEMMQKLLVLKDEQLAALQNQSSTESQPAEDANRVQQQVKQLAGDEVQPHTQETSDADTAKPVKVEAPVAKPVPPTPSKPQPVAQEAEGNFLSDNYFSLLGAVAFLLACVIGLIWWRRNSQDELTDTESMFASSSEITMPDSEVTETVGEDDEAYDVGTVGESSFLSEFTPSDFDAFETEHSEVDPIQEADVYLAYGRFQQAEDLIKQAISENPDRDDSKLKLLEIYYASENQEAFSGFVSELSAAGKDQDKEFWLKVEEMSKEVLSTGTTAIDAKVPEDKGESSEQVDSEPAKETFDIDEELDFDLDAFNVSDEEESTVEKAISLEESLESVDFDFTENQQKESVPEEESLSVTEDEIESLDFDFSSVTEDTAEAGIELDISDEEASIQDEIESLGGLDFESSVEDTSTQEELSGGIEGNVPESLDDEFDFSFDESFLQSSSAEAGTTSESDESVSDLTDMDEYETKLDLAKAYIDMGDEDAAKSIVEEVIEKGNEQQQETAKSLLEELH